MPDHLELRSAVAPCNSGLLPNVNFLPKAAYRWLVNYPGELCTQQNGALIVAIYREHSQDLRAQLYQWRHGYWGLSFHPVVLQGEFVHLLSPWGIIAQP